MRKRKIPTIDELIESLSNAYRKNSNIKNAAIRKAYRYAEALGLASDEKKEYELSLMLHNENVYVKYWGAIIALSYEVLKKQALTCLINILDMKNPLQKDGVLDFDLNIVKMDIEADLFDYKKHKKLGSYPGQVSYEPSILPNAKHAIRYYRNYISKQK